MPYVTRPKQDLDPEIRARLRKAATKRATIDNELRQAVLDALDSGGSIRVIAHEANVSTRTVQDWKAGR